MSLLEGAMLLELQALFGEKSPTWGRVMRALAERAIIEISPRLRKAPINALVQDDPRMELIILARHLPSGRLNVQLLRTVDHPRLVREAIAEGQHVSVITLVPIVNRLYLRLMDYLVRPTRRAARLQDAFERGSSRHVRKLVRRWASQLR